MVRWKWADGYDTLARRIECVASRVTALERGECDAKRPAVDDESDGLGYDLHLLRDAIIGLREVIEQANSTSSLCASHPLPQYRSKCVARDHDACACKTCLLPMIVGGSERTP